MNREYDKNYLINSKKETSTDANNNEMITNDVQFTYYSKY